MRIGVSIRARATAAYSKMPDSRKESYWAKRLRFVSLRMDSLLDTYGANTTLPLGGGTAAEFSELEGFKAECMLALAELAEKETEVKNAV